MRANRYHTSVVGKASSPAALQLVEDKVQSARTAALKRMECLNASESRSREVRQLQREREFTKAGLIFMEFAKLRLSAVEQDISEKGMVLVEKDKE